MECLALSDAQKDHIPSQKRKLEITEPTEKSVLGTRYSALLVGGMAGTGVLVNNKYNTLNKKILNNYLIKGKNLKEEDLSLSAFEKFLMQKHISTRVRNFEDAFERAIKERVSLLNVDDLNALPRQIQAVEDAAGKVLRIYDDEMDKINEQLKKGLLVRVDFQNNEELNKEKSGIESALVPLKENIRKIKEVFPLLKMPELEEYLNSAELLKNTILIKDFSLLKTFFQNQAKKKDLLSKFLIDIYEILKIIREYDKNSQFFKENIRESIRELNSGPEEDLYLKYVGLANEKDPDIFSKIKRFFGFGSPFKSDQQIAQDLLQHLH